MAFTKAVITFIGGLYFVMFFLLSEQTLEAIGVLPTAHGLITNGFIVIGTIACGVGLLNLLLIHSRNTLSLNTHQNSHWFYSAVLLVALCSTVGFGVSDWIQEKRIMRFAQTAAAYQGFFLEHPEDLSDQYKHSIETFVSTGQGVFHNLCRSADIIGAVSISASSESTCQKLRQALTTLSAAIQGRGTAAAAAGIADQFRSIAVLQSSLLELRAQESLSAKVTRICNEGIFIPLGSSMFSLLAFYIASAAFQAFSIRSFESAFLMVAATLVIIGQTSVGSMLWDGFPAIRSWLLTVPNTAAFRGISLGASVAALILAIRVWLSLDKTEAVTEVQ